MSREVSIGHYTDPGDRSENEDSYEIRTYKNNLVIVIADGLGGQGDGKAASSLVSKELVKCGSDNMIVNEEELHKAFIAANELLLGQQKNSTHMKSTAVYLCISKDRAIWAHIGDSRLYHFYGDELKEVTLDQSIGQLAVFMGEISREQIPTYRGRSKLLHAMGTPEEDCVVAEPIPLQHGKNVFLLCTDGVWENNSEEWLKKVVLENDAEIAAQIIKEKTATYAGNELDNNTAVVITLIG